MARKRTKADLILDSLDELHEKVDGLLDEEDDDEEEKEEEEEKEQDKE